MGIEGQAVVTGGGSILATSSASWPFAILRYDGEGIGLRIKIDGSSCAFKWSEVVAIDRAPRSLVVRGLQSRSFRFVVLRARTLDSVIRAAQSHGVAVEAVDSTLRWFVHPD